MKTFQEHLDALNEKSPPTYICQPYHSNFRHLCEGQMIGGRATSRTLELHEKYLTAEELNEQAQRSTPHQPGEASELGWIVDENPGTAMIWREGTCRKQNCGATARSDRIFVVSQEIRPPLQGRVAR